MKNRFKTISEFKTFLESKNYKEDEINEFINFIKPFFNFYDFMLEKHKMSFTQVEEDLSNFSQNVFSEYLSDMSKSESQLQYMIEIGGDIMKRYANKYDYLDSEKVKIALNKYMEILLINELKK